MLRSRDTNFFISILEWEIHFLNRLRIVNEVTVKFRRYLLVLVNEEIFLLLLDTLKCENGVAMTSCFKLGSIFKSCWGVDLFCEKFFRERRNSKTHRLEIAYDRTPHWVDNVRDCLKMEDSVKMCNEGVGGTYFIRDQKKKEIIGVFKPMDEEPGAVLNPKKIIKEPLMPPGGGAIREVAAFLLDRKGTAGVPETILLQNIYHSNFNNNQNDLLIPKTGSLQKFIPNIGNAESMGSSCFSVNDVHHIGILDIRLLNLDRNAENILLVKPDPSTSEIRLVPIDHTFTLPETLGSFYFEWLYWRQAKLPFSPETLEFIKAIDIDEDCAVLQKLGIPNTAILNMKLATILLKKGASAGMSLFQLGSWIAPRKWNEVSPFRKLVEKAQGLGKMEKKKKNNSTGKIFEQLLDEFIGSCVES